MLRETPPRALGRQNFVACFVRNSFFNFVRDFARLFFSFLQITRGNFVSQERKGGIVINRPSLSKRQGKETLEERAKLLQTN